MRSDALGGASLALFFAIVFFAGCIALGLMLVNVTIPAWRTRHKFIACTAKLLDKRMDEVSGEQGTRFQPSFRVNYEVAQRKQDVWTSEMPRPFTSDRASSQAILDRFEVGHDYPCWYDPFDPSRAVLLQGYRVQAWLVLIFPVSFIALGGGGLAWSLANLGKSVERRAALAQRAAQLDPFVEPDPIGRRFPHVPGQGNLTNSPGTTLAFRLPSTVSNWKLLGGLIICLFWNGVVLVFAVIAVESFRLGEPEWFLALALVPLALIGLGLVYLVLRQLWVLTGLGPTIVEIDRHPLIPGSSYQLFVAQSGRLAVNWLSLSLVCDEEATFRQGTNLRADTCQVYRHEIHRQERFVVKPEKPMSIRCRFDVPLAVMHSFNSEHNRVIWKLIVEADVIGWPRIERAYALQVYPSPAEGDLL